jgi:hypothetical protein
MRVDLNGDWERHVHGKLVSVVPVPSSQRPSGFYRLKRSFLLPKLSGQERVVLHFEGITYHGRVFVNGAELGSMLSYVPYDFDFTSSAQEGKNTIEVVIVDAAPEPDGTGKDDLAFGITTGWETYGGIIREVWTEIRPSAYIENVRFGYELTDDYGTAPCKAQVFVDSAKDGTADCELGVFWMGAEVAKSVARIQLKAGINEVPLSFDVSAPALWSPDDPNLYQLKAKVKSEAGEHAWQCRTGFRKIATQGRQFLLNGKPIILNGICRMELWKDQGFTMDRRQHEADMRAIKTLGANFVRLQPFPHHRSVIELADELGLLISEESGFWNMDFQTMPRSEVELGNKILELTIRRDWNSPSVMIWFLGNECVFPIEFLKEGKALCDRVDPIRRLVSVAHHYGKFPAVKNLFDDAGLDFYDWHAYDYSEDKFGRLAEDFGANKPLTLSEWGWESAGEKPLFHERYFDKLLDQVQAGNIAGHMFFDWNDYPLFTRDDWATENGMLLSGVVNEAREIRQPIYSRLAGLFAGRRELQVGTGDARPKPVPLESIPFSLSSGFQIVDLRPLVDSPTQRRAWNDMENSLEQFWAATSFAKDQWARTGKAFRLWQGAETQIASADFRSPVVDGYVRPLLISSSIPEITIPIEGECLNLHILGQVAFPAGYPVVGAMGDVSAIYTLEYRDGKKQELLVRNGFEVAQANCITEATRINPTALNAQPVLRFNKDVVREQYQILLWSIPTAPGVLARLRCKAISGNSWIAIFAITREVAR